jgi:large subunit ribosomal protein L27e
MGKILKKGKVVIMLAGRYAGKKAIIVKTFDDGTNDRKFPHALVAGIARNPRKVTRTMSKAKVAKKTKIKPFIKAVNFTHLMPTRYQCDLELQSAVTLENMAEGKKEGMSKTVKKMFEARYMNQDAAKSDKAFNGTQFFFDKLRF